MRSALTIALSVGLLVSALAATAPAQPTDIEGEGDGLEPVAHIQWDGGTDMEVVRIKGRDYAFAGSTASLTEGGGLHVVDVTKPEEAKEVAHLECV